MQLNTSEVVADRNFHPSCELALEQLFSELGAQDFSVNYCGSLNLSVEERLWICFLDKHGRHFALSSEHWGKSVDLTTYFNSVLSCTRSLAEGSSGICILPRYFPERFCGVFKVRLNAKRATDQMWTGLLYFCGETQVWSELLRPQEGSAASSSPAQIAVRIMAQALHRKAKKTIAPRGCYLSSPLASQKLRHRVKLELQQENLVFEILEGTYMKPECGDAVQPADNESIEMDVCLGTITLKLTDFLALRPGAKISVLKPNPFQVILKLGDQQFALADVEFGEEQVALSVAELFS